MKVFSLIIFDCDGVLVDSEPVTNGVFRDMLSELGADVNLEYLFEHFVGHSMEYCLGLVRGLIGRDPPSDFEAEYRKRTALALASELRPVRGIHEALRRIPIPFCVASNGSPDKMRATLGLTGLLGHFEGRMFSAAQVARPKPAPDVFLFAAERMGISPADAVVIEDTPIGVAAGCAAGMTVFGYAGLTPAHRLRAAGASAVFTDMADLPPLLGGTN